MIPTQPKPRYETDDHYIYDSPPDGLPLDQMQARWSEIMRYAFDPTELSSDYQPTPGMLSALLDTFGEVARKGEVKFFFHPWFKRWGLWERDSRYGMQWHCFYLHCTAPVEEQLPSDYGPEYGQVEGLIGEFAVPNKRDLELVRELSDSQYLTPQERLMLHKKADLDNEANWACEMEAREHDLADYIFNAVATEENAGHKMYCHYVDEKECRQVAREAKLQKHEYFQRNGYEVRVRYGSKEHERELERMAHENQLREAAAQDELMRMEKEAQQIRERQERHAITVGRDIDARRKTM